MGVSVAYQRPHVAGVRESVAPATLADLHSILVVEDEVAISRILVDALRLHGYRACSAGAIAEALDLLENEPFDLVISDLWLPDLTGADLLNELVRRDPGWRRRFVLITGEALAAERMGLTPRNGIALLAKPFRLPELIRTVREALARPGVYR